MSEASKINSAAYRRMFFRPLFNSSPENFLLGRGAFGWVQAVTPNVAFKFPHSFVNKYDDTESSEGREFSLTMGDLLELEDYREKIEKEKAIYDVLNAHPHPNILHSILHIPEGIFMPLMKSTLADALELPSVASLDRQELWIYQLVSAAAWFEKVGYYHGDLRPQNILLDDSDDIMVADFDFAAVIGSQLTACLPPFSRPIDPSLGREGGPISEQFALGSIIYNIRFKVEPFYDPDVDSHVWEQKIVREEFPPTTDDRFGEIIQKCWNGSFPSIAAVHSEVAMLMGIKPKPQTPSRRHRWYLLAECQEWMTGQRLLQSSSAMERLTIHCHSIYWTTLRSVLGFFESWYPSGTPFCLEKSKMIKRDYLAC